MSQSYDEIVEGEGVRRTAPGTRHEAICVFLHQQVAANLNGASRLLPPRSIIQLQPGTLARPDLALVTVATGKLWLAAEIISPDDHRVDTVLKKTIYESINIPRLWMVDPRYDNVEVYHGGFYGLALHQILAGRETLEEPLLPGLQLAVSEIFPP